MGHGHGVGVGGWRGGGACTCIHSTPAEDEDEHEACVIFIFSSGCRVSKDVPEAGRPFVLTRLCLLAEAAWKQPGDRMETALNACRHHANHRPPSNHVHSTMVGLELWKGSEWYAVVVVDQDQINAQVLA